MVGQVKRDHLSFLLVTIECINKIKLFLARIEIKLASCHLLLYAVYSFQNHLILLMRSILTSKNERWPRLI